MPAEAGPRWPASLRLSAQRQGERTVVHAQHEGPLRLLKTLYPEGTGIAHAVIVHPPGGLVGGDRLDIKVDVEPGAHLLATTPAATRFYRSSGAWAEQQVQARVAAGARLEWLPQETLAYRHCKARNSLRVSLQGELLASELLGLGLPAADEPFSEGELLQHLEIEGLWIDRGWLRAQDRALLDSPCGLGGRRVLGTLVAANTQAFEASLAADLLEATRALCTGTFSSTTLLHGRLLLLRVLADDIEPASALLQRARGLWRQQLWGLPPHEPRVWRT